MGLEFKQVPQENLGEVVYKTISEALISGDLRAGDKLRIREIAAQMGTSVTPVRDAILRLVQENAIILRNARDIRVRALSLEEYIEIRTIRIELEGLAAAQAAKKVTKEDIDRIEKLFSEGEKAVKHGDFSTSTKLNQQFHFELVKIAQAPILLEILEGLWMRIGPLIAGAYEAGDLDMVKHHRPIINAIKERNPKKARAAIKNDLMAGGEIIREYLATIDSNSD